jgi:uncharacterized membrane protein
MLNKEYSTKIINLSIAFFFFFISTLHFSCSNVHNDKNAYVIKEDGHTYLILTGNRKYIVHDLISVFQDKTYRDSILIEIPLLKVGTIEGKKFLYEPVIIPIWAI